MKELLKRWLPGSLKKRINVMRSHLVDKYAAELKFWQSRYKADNGVFENDQYEKYFLAMAGEDTPTFLKDKIVVDFGCGPRGSLAWTDAPKLKIGLDVLVDHYADHFADNMIHHNMLYIKCTEKVIPIPSAFADVVFTLNAMDHVDNFQTMCSELMRILKPGGTFIGSFNLGESRSPAEPQTLSESMIRNELLDHMTVVTYRVTQKGPAADTYSPFFTKKLIPIETGSEGYLWVRATRN